jgi:hypothetical protein
LRPLHPWAVMKEIAALLARRGIANCSVWGDQHSADAIADIAARVGVHFFVQPITAQNRGPMFETLKAALSMGVLEIPPDPVLAADLGSVKRRLTPQGITYDLPRGRDGRHSDYTPALCLALSKMPQAGQTRAAARRAAWETRMVGQMALQGYGPEGMSTEVAGRLAAGESVDDAEMSFWARIARAQEFDRQQAELKKAG